MFVSATPRRLWIAGVAAFSLLVAAPHVTLSRALVPWLHVLPVYLIIGVVIELLHLGDRQRVTVERLAEQLSLANQQLQDYMAKAEALAVAEERARMAREMHDTLGHDLTKLDVQLALATRLPANRMAERESLLQDAVKLVKSGLRNLRAAVHALREDQEQGFALPQALIALADDFQRQAPLAVTCRFAVSADASPLPPPVALCLYRAAQEGLTNVIKHARASKATVFLEVTPQAAELTVSDDGRGSSRGEIGFGLRGLTERSGKLGGTLTAGPRPEGGFELNVSLPR